jgi:superfamily II DNA/RNA helicase
MAAAQIMYAEHASAADPWLTTVGYFNALRELGSMRRAVEDSVRGRLERRDDAGKRYVNFQNVEELTSRKSAEDIPKILDRLENQFVRDENGRYPEGKNPLDVVLATNMISVGVDVDRLGLMIAAGQPKATAEYIQATSRVGRKFPGVVGTVYSWTRPRDLSHYERFEHYHATFYRQVEALSVTPFAERALDRGLSGVLTALIRLLDTTFNHNHGAGEFDKTHPVVQQARELLKARARRVTHDENSVTYLEQSISSSLDRWAKETKQESARLGYRMKKDSETIGLLKDPIEDSYAIFTVLNSMRDVEATAGLILRDKAAYQEGEA